MKALVYTGPRQSAYREVANPEPGPGEVLVRIAAVGLCGSDMHAYLGHDARRPAPLVLGHEAVGTIEAVGEGADARIGTRVAINPLVTCQTCEDCRAGRENLCGNREIISMPPREGAFAELIAVPTRNLVAIPDDVPFARAVAIEPLACGWHAVGLARRTAIEPPGETRVLVIGGGAIGIGAALCARARGHTDITVSEPSETRRAAVERAGFRALNPDMAAREAMGAHLVVDAVGFGPTRDAAFALVRSGGTIVHIGLGSGEGGMDARAATLREIAFQGAYTYTADEFRETAGALFAGQLGPIDWAEQRALKDGPSTLEEAANGTLHAPKVVFVPSTSPAG